MVRLNQALGLVLAGFRRDAGLSQESLAFECGLHPTYISQVERGLKSPTLRTLFLLAEALKVKPSEILVEVEAHLLKGGRR